MIRKILPVIAFAVLVPCVATADSIVFMTRVTFSNPGLLPIGGVLQNGQVFRSGYMTLNHFRVGHCPTNKCHGSETFTITIIQSFPVHGATGQMVGTVSGYVLKDGQTDLAIHFANSVSFNSAHGTITYYGLTQSIHTSGEYVPIKGFLSAPRELFPEPNAELLLGMGALGLMGLATASRKLIST